ncbi:hypothetical protein Tco_0820013 [Tanacetum coccineum]|uniref:Uncharacterized protein n=1 Tax=Tanacetum coccineum TaxID=301880 RepID=A0ABQ5ACH7_9ASTR
MKQRLVARDTAKKEGIDYEEKLRRWCMSLQPKDLMIPYFPKHVYRVVKVCMDFIKHSELGQPIKPGVMTFEGMMKGEFEMKCYRRNDFLLWSTVGSLRLEVIMPGSMGSGKSYTGAVNLLAEAARARFWIQNRSILMDQDLRIGGPILVMVTPFRELRGGGLIVLLDILFIVIVCSQYCVVYLIPADSWFAGGVLWFAGSYLPAGRFLFRLDWFLLRLYLWFCWKLLFLLDSWFLLGSLGYDACRFISADDRVVCSCVYSGVCCWLDFSCLVPLVTWFLRMIMILLVSVVVSSAGSTPMSGSAVPDTAGAPLDTTGTASTVPTSAAMDSAASQHELGISPFADSEIIVLPRHLYVCIAADLALRVADPDSDDEVLAEILFRGQYISGAGVVVVDKLPVDEIVDPRVKVETVSTYVSSPPRSRRKHRGVRSDDFLWDKPVEDFFSSESESDDDMATYIPPLPYGGFKDWEIVSCPLRNISYHVYHQENRRQKCFTYLKELLPHVYREDLLLLRRRMNRYFRLNPDVDVGLDLWRDVNLLCQSLHSDDVEDFWRTQDEWVVSSWKLYPKSSVHVLDLTNGKTVYMFVDKVYPIRATLLERMLRHRLTVPPSYCRDVVVAGSVIQTVQAGLRESYECLASVPIACTARQMVFSSPWLTAKKESGSPLQTALVCNSNPLIALLLRDVAASFDSAVHRVHAVSFDAAVASIVSAACCAAAGYFVYCCCLLCSCCSSILLPQEDLSRNLELTESTPSLGEDCWDKLQTTKCRFCLSSRHFLLIIFLLVHVLVPAGVIESVIVIYRRINGNEGI